MDGRVVGKGVGEDYRTLHRDDGPLDLQLCQDWGTLIP